MDLDAAGASFAGWLLSIARDEPALIVGYSYGVNLAFDVASRLQIAGCRVALLSLLDPALPNTEFEVHQRGSAIAMIDAPLQRPELVYRACLLRTALLGVCRLASPRTRHRIERRTLCKLRSYARRGWRPRGFDCPVLHIMTQQFAPAVAKGLAQLCPGIRQVGIGNRHVDLLKGIALSDVVKVVSAAIGAAAPRQGDAAGCQDEAVAVPTS